MPVIEKSPRHFVSDDLVIDTFESVSVYFDLLEKETIPDAKALELWLKKLSELEAVLEEDLAWRYIQMTADTSNKDAAASYTKFITEINPKISEASNRLDKKLNASPFKAQLKSHANELYFKKLATAIELFNEKNIPLEAKAAELAQKYAAITGAQTISWNGTDITAQQAYIHLKDPDRTVRKAVYDLLYSRKNQDTESLEEIFDELISIRHEIGLNSGFSNFRDYKFKAMNRFDYTVDDCLAFHRSVEKHIVPIFKKIQQEKLNQFGFDKFKPWDTAADPTGKKPLRPFETGKELLEKSIDVFEKVDPYFASCLKTMDQMGHLDLESKIGKAPGGYNYPLYEIGIPFIFMNAANSSRDVITMVHEGGHAVHSFLSKDLELTAYKNFPSEVAELASMSMELLTMKYWEIFYPEFSELNRARQEHLESILMILPWIAQIDAFQHWIYENPKHRRDERKNCWKELTTRFGTGLTDWSGYETALDYSWHKQLHLFEVPFYYIEYGFSQLGALGIWSNSLKDEKSAVKQYKDGLALGYTRDIRTVYNAAGVEFEFSEARIKAVAKDVTSYLSML